MNAEFCKGVEDLLELFKESLTPSEMLYAKLTAQVSAGITKERLKLNMTQTEFAQHMGATQPIISRWESGDCNFSVKKLAEIAALLNLDINIYMMDMSTRNVYSEYCDNKDYTQTLRYSSDYISTETNNTTYYQKKYENSVVIKEEHTYASIC